MLPLDPLDPRQRSVLRIRAGFAGAIFIGVTLVAAIAAEGSVRPIPLLVAAIAVALLMQVSVARRYRSWGYRVDADELHVGHGVLTRVRTVVPFARVQHIDVAQGPLQRRFGLGTLVLHTAGTRASTVGLPGLRYEEAERLRDEIRSKIRQEPA